MNPGSRSTPTPAGYDPPTGPRRLPRSPMAADRSRRSRPRRTRPSPGNSPAAAGQTRNSLPVSAPPALSPAPPAPSSPLARLSPQSPAQGEQGPASPAPAASADRTIRGRRTASAIPDQACQSPLPVCSLSDPHSPNSCPWHHPALAVRSPPSANHLRSSVPRPR